MSTIYVRNIFKLLCRHYGTGTGHRKLFSGDIRCPQYDDDNHQTIVAAAHTAQIVRYYPAIDLYSYIHKLRISSWLGQRRMTYVRIVIVRYGETDDRRNQCGELERGDNTS